MRNIFLIFRRDYLSYVTAWGFWLGLLALPLLGFLAGSFVSLASNATPTRYYAVIENGTTYSDALNERFAPPSQEEMDKARERISEVTGLPDETTSALTDRALEEMDDRRFIEVKAPERDIDGLRPYLLGEKTLETPEGQKPLFAAIIVSEAGNEIEYWSEAVNNRTLLSATQRVARSLNRETALKAAGLDPDFLKTVDESGPDVLERRIRSVEEQETAGDAVTLADRAPTYVSLAGAYILWLMIFSVIQYLLMGTIEERGNKIFDTLLTSVRMPELIAGKLLAVFAVTMTMMGAWGLFGGIGTAYAAATFPGASEVINPIVSAIFEPKLVIPALISFALGYVMFGMIFMALGSLCDTIQEAQTLLSPMMILLMLPMLAIVISFNDPGSPVVDIASWIPIFTPFLMILRMPYDPPMWEIIAQLTLMALTTALMVWLASKVYRLGAVNGAGIADIGSAVKRSLTRRKA